MTDTVRVPREPTQAMIAAVEDINVPLNIHGAARAIWSAMLAASPQGEGSSADADTPQPDALPGDLRERVGKLIEDWPFRIDGQDGADELADAILSLIQSERGEP